jgi:hypothetical protein
MGGFHLMPRNESRAPANCALSIRPIDVNDLAGVTPGIVRERNEIRAADRSTWHGRVEFSK